MATQTTQMQGTSVRPVWLAPVVVLVVIVVLAGIGSKKKEAVENPLVDLAVLTVGVFAFAAVFRFAAAHLGSPGLAAFFGGNPDLNSNKGLM